MSFGLKELSKRYFNSVDDQYFDKFDVITPEGNRVEGYICTEPSYYLGSLLITCVNNEPTIQFVQSMPKIHYPDTSPYTYTMSIYEVINCYEKMDGTCIIMYNLLDHNQVPIEILFKTRNTVVANDEILQLIPNNLQKYYHNFKRNPQLIYYFELYGQQNKHMINYNIPIDMKCFAVSNNALFIDYYGDKPRLIFQIQYKKDGTYMVHPTHNFKLQSDVNVPDLTSAYKVIKEYLEEINQENIKRKGYPIIEGVVLQGRDENKNHLFIKLKPESVIGGLNYE